MADPGEINDSIEKFVQTFTHPDAMAWAATAAKRVQAHVVARRIAEGNAQAAQAFTNNIATTKSNLQQIVRGDPTALDMALDLVPHTVRALTSQHGLGDEHTAALTQHMQAEIAHAAVISLAQQDYGAASKMLTGDRVSALLPQDQREGLGDYIVHQENLRRTDHIAAMRQAQNDAYERDHRTAGDWLGSLAHPTTGDAGFPPGWGQNVMNDPRLLNATKGALHGAYQTLLVNGSPDTSNPQTFTKLLDQVANGKATQADVLSRVGHDLSLRDAKFLHDGIRPPTDHDQANLEALNTTIQDAKSMITEGSGPAGQQAFGRFMDWYMPTYQRMLNAGVGAPDLLHPETGLLAGATLAKFMPTADDALQAVLPSLGQLGHSSDLGQIFGQSMYGSGPRGTPDTDFLEGPSGHSTGQPPSLTEDIGPRPWEDEGRWGAAGSNLPKEGTSMNDDNGAAGTMTGSAKDI